MLVKDFVVYEDFSSFNFMLSRLLRIIVDIITSILLGRVVLSKIAMA